MEIIEFDLINTVVTLVLVNYKAYNSFCNSISEGNLNELNFLIDLNG